MFLYDGNALMEDLFIHFIENSKEQILSIREDSDIESFFKEIPLKILKKTPMYAIVSEI